jgi:hypothetical protein
LIRGNEKLEAEIDGPDTRGHVDVKCGGFRRVALPLQRIAGRTDHQAGELIESVGRHRVAYDPLREQ